MKNAGLSRILSQVVLQEAAPVEQILDVVIVVCLQLLQFVLYVKTRTFRRFWVRARVMPKP